MYSKNERRVVKTRLSKKRYGSEGKSSEERRVSESELYAFDIQMNEKKKICEFTKSKKDIVGRISRISRETDSLKK